MRSGGGSFASTGLHIGQDWSGHLSTYPDYPPILTIGAGSATVTVYIAGTEVTTAAVEFAHELARQAAEFAAEMARIHARQHPDDGNGNSTPDGEAP
jgi:precorrin-6B methylase 2